MVTNIEGVSIYSGDAGKLAEFYRETVGMKQTFEAVMGEGEESNLFGFEMGKVTFYIIYHSEVKGKSDNPKRNIINFEVDDLEKDVKKLDKAGVKKIADIYHVEEYGYIATFEDLDGNYFQLVKTTE